MENEPEWMLDFRLKSLKLFYKNANAFNGVAIYQNWISMTLFTM